MEHYTPGTVVYAKLKGFPWWPARVEIESSLPQNVLSKKPKGSKPIWSVRFFGSKDYGWFGPNDLKMFDNIEAEETLQKMKGKKRDKNLEKAIREALTPSSLDEPDEQDDEESESEDNKEMDDESKKSSDSHENDKTDTNNKGSKSRGKFPKNREKGSSSRQEKVTRRKSVNSRSRKKSQSYADDDNDNEASNIEGGTKKRRAVEGASADKSLKRKQRKIDYTDEEDAMEVDHEEGDFEQKKERTGETPHKEGIPRSEGSGSPEKSEIGSQDGGDEQHEDRDANLEQKKTRSVESHSRASRSKQASTSGDKLPGDKLLHLRHKLQKSVLKENIEDMDKIDALFNEVENFPITLTLLKDTKIGKLMKKIQGHTIEPDPYNIKERCNNLIKKWKSLLTQAPLEVTEEETSPKVVQGSPRPEVEREAKYPEEILFPGHDNPGVDASQMDTDLVQVGPSTEPIVTNGASPMINVDFHNENEETNVRPHSPQA